MTSRIRTAAVIAGLGSLIALSACTAAPAGTTNDPDTEESVTPVVMPETACPDGFVQAFASASAFAFDGDLVVTEISVDEFEPAFLAPFLDGGCALHIVGTQLMSSGGFPIDTDYGFAPDASAADAVAAAFEAEGYTEDPNYPGGFQSADGMRFGGAFPIGGEVTTTGYDANEQFYPDGVVFYG